MPSIRSLRLHACLSAIGLATILATGLAIMLTIGGCTAQNGSSGTPSAWGQPKQQRINPRLLQLDLMNFADRFATRMSDAYDHLADSATSAAAKDLALDRKINGATAAYGNAVDPSPIVGLMDMLVMVRLVHQSSEEPWFTEMFGEQHSAKIVSSLRLEEDDITRIGGRYLTVQQLAELREATDRWRSEHPNLRYVAMARISDFPEAVATQTSKNKRSRGSVFALLFLDPLSGLDPAMREVERTRETAERMFFYLQRMPLLVSWGAEAAARRMLASPQVQQFVDGIATFADGPFADSAESLADSVERFPQVLTEERERSVQQLARVITDERTAALKQLGETVAVERNAAIQQSAEAIAVQRDAAVRQIAGAVETEREQIIRVATTQIASERDATIAQLNASIQSQRQGLAQDMEALTTRSINRLFVYALIVVAVAVGLATIAALALRAGRGRRRELGAELGSNEDTLVRLAAQK